MQALYPFVYMTVQCILDMGVDGTSRLKMTLVSLQPDLVVLTYTVHVTCGTPGTNVLLIMVNVVKYPVYLTDYSCYQSSVT